jgi:glycine betaine/proline transport system substrate-binding protein
MDNSTIGRMTAEVDLEGKSVREVALQWLKSNEATWKSWASCSK